jgi:Tfp pilus assembly protein PilF
VLLHGEEKRMMNARTYINRGLAFCNRGRYEQAISAFSEAIKIDPTYAKAYFNKATAYEKAGHREEAMEEYRTFIQKVSQDDPDIQYARYKLRELEELV